MKLNVYYHIWAPQDDYLVRFLIDEQIKRLELNSLTNQATVHVSVVGKAAGVISNYVKKIYHANIRQTITKEEGWELHTLKLMHNDCIADPDQYVMYMHTKGLSHFYNSPTNTPWASNVNTWRKFMEYVCIDEWRDCVKDLEHCDATGMNLYKEPFTHYSGNFWWSTGEHIAKLKDPFDNAHKNPAPDRPGVTQRHNAEAWVGSIPGKYKTRLQIAGSMYSSQKFSQYKVVTSQ